MTHSHDVHDVETAQSNIEQELARASVDADPVAGNQRLFEGRRNALIAIMCVAYTIFHLLVMNVYPLETWAYRLTHVGGGLLLGFLLFGSSPFTGAEAEGQSGGLLSRALLWSAAPESFTVWPELPQSG